MDSSFGPNIIAEYYVTDKKVPTDVLKEFADKHGKKDIADASANREDLKFYSSEINSEPVHKKNLYLGFILKEDEDIVELKSVFEKIETDIVQNYSDDKKKLQALLKKNLQSFLSLLEKLKEPKIIKETINEKTKKLLDEGKLQEARELIELGEKIPAKLSEEIKQASTFLHGKFYGKARRSYLKAADYAAQIQETEMVDFLKKKAENIGEIPDIVKTLNALNKAIKKGLETLANKEEDIYEKVVPLIEKNIKISSSLEDEEFMKKLEELNKYCTNASKKAKELNKLNSEIIRLLEAL